MKKITAILLTTALLAALTGCGKTEGNSESVPSSDTPSGSTAPSKPESSEDGVPESSDSAEIDPGVPEKQQPDGEPTFLIGLDGEPIYTSEITQIFAFDPEIGESVQVDRLDRESFSEAVCEGFTYVYTPRPSVNFMSHPELFEASEDGEYYYYIGEELPDSYEFTRVNVGDKIGDLTVKAASSYFAPSGYEGSEQFYEQGNIEFEGEVELTGFVRVTEEHPLYPENGGKIFFYPDSASSIKIPCTLFDINYEDEYMARHYVNNSFYGWYGDGADIFLGNIADIDSELREGDMYVKVRVVVGDIIVNLGAEAVIREIELI
ncbi:MAG: hypothetical protein K2N38_12670 [Oscillospiraceae bacterium]|nr:hypothetical protein [Oscillospiraceae bacterium]